MRLPILPHDLRPFHRSTRARVHRRLLGGIAVSTTILVGSVCSDPDEDPTGDDKTITSDTTVPDTTGDSGDTTGGGDDDDGGPDEDIDCTNLPAVPAAFEIIEGPASSEDFVFDAEGRLLSVQETNVYATTRGGSAELLIPGAFSFETAGTLMLKNGDLVVADVEAGELIRMSLDGIKKTLASGLSYPNGVSSDRQGYVYVSEHDAGRVRRVDAETGEFTIVAEDLINPNGLAFSPDYSRLYICSFGGGTVHSVDIAADGTPSNLHVFAEGFGGTGGDGGPPSTYEQLLELAGDKEFADMIVDACSGNAVGGTCAIDFGDGDEYPGLCEAFDDGQLFCWPDGEGVGFDGLGVDVCGNVYVTEYVAGILWRVNTDGTTEVVADFSEHTDWIPNIRWGTGVGGWETRMLYVMDRDGDRVYEVDLGIPGVVPPHLE